MNYLLNPSAWSDNHCSSRRKRHLSWSDSTARHGARSHSFVYISTTYGANVTGLLFCSFVKELALLWCGRQYLEIISSFFLCSRILGFRFAVAECQAPISWCTLSLIRLYLDNVGSKCNRAALCLLVKELALLWCERELLEIISLFYSLLSNFGFSFRSRGVLNTACHGARSHSFVYISTT